MQEKTFITWEEIDKIVSKLAFKIKESDYDFKSIHGIKRGGLIPAVILSHKLGIPYTNSIKADTLVVDDICDSGYTLENTVGLYTAALHYKSHTSKFKPTFYSEELTEDFWIVYPWESVDSKPIQGYIEKREAYSK